MTSLLFVRKPDVYLPEVSAYEKYLAKHFPEVKTSQSTDLKDYNLNDYDIVWHFMGLDRSGGGRYVVHEYNSLSTQPFAAQKNIIKRILNAKPNRRVFLNETVKDVFRFNDQIPGYLRDMGIDQAFFNTLPNLNPEYDFICCGGLNRGPVLSRILEHFESRMDGASILLVGEAPQFLQEQFAGAPNITFQGRVTYDKVPNLMGKARYGLNIMPDIYPFNIQTATKVLEYAAMGLSIVSTDYQWIRQYEEKYGGRCFKLSSDMRNLSMQALEDFDFVTPDLSSLQWHNIIKQSEIFSFLE